MQQPIQWSFASLKDDGIFGLGEREQEQEQVQEQEQEYERCESSGRGLRSWK